MRNKLKSAFDHAFNAGLNLSAVLKWDQVRPILFDVLKNHGVNGDQYKSLLVFGHAGPFLWKNLARNDLNQDHPIDSYSTRIVENILINYFNNIPYLFVYPGIYKIPLQQIGHKLGWGKPSLLGLDIHPEHGTWFAYRAVVLVDIDVTEFIDSVSPIDAKVEINDVCANCIEKPCITACPSFAVQLNKFHLDRCIDYRVRPSSKCSDRCLSRLECPVGTRFRYSDEQIRYHESLVHKSIRNINKDIKI